MSHFTFPHFIRFLFYTVFGTGYLETLLFQRASIVWADRNLPGYLGPSLSQLVHLFILIVVNSFICFALFILFVRTVWSLGSNITTIESWEIERHQTLVRRARYFGGFLDGPGGAKIRIKKQEFPYDIGIWANTKAGMGGSRNILGWFWPLAASPDRSTGLVYEVNEFEDPGLSWPPPDPDRIPRPIRPVSDDGAFTMPQYSSAREQLEAFNQRQQEDFQRRRVYSQVQRRRRFHERLEHQDEPGSDSAETWSEDDDSAEGEEGWRNSEGERLGDFGVDEEAEFYDEEDIPLGVLIERRGNRFKE